MEPNFSPEIQRLVDKKPLEKNEMYLLKDALMQYAVDYLDKKKGKNNNITLTDVFVNDLKVKDANYDFIRDIGRRMERTRDYMMNENEKGDKIVVVPLDRGWHEKNPVKYSLLIALFGACLTVLGGVSLNLLKPQPPAPVYVIEDARIAPLYDSISILSKKVNSRTDTSGVK